MSNEREHETRKIIMTGIPSLHNATEALNKGAAAYFTKPLNVERTLKRVKELLEKQGGE